MNRDRLTQVWSAWPSEFATAIISPTANSDTLLKVVIRFGYQKGCGVRLHQSQPEQNHHRHPRSFSRIQVPDGWKDGRSQ